VFRRSRSPRALPSFPTRRSSDLSLVGATPGKTIREVVRRLRPGAIVLLHDLHPWTPEVAHAVLRAARKKRLRAVTVSQLLARQPPTARQLGSEGAARCPGR